MHTFQELFKQEASDSIQEQTICFFRFQSLGDSETVLEALRHHRGVFCDLSDMEASEVLRFKDVMQGVCVTLHASSKEICEDYVTYFPDNYHLQIYES